ncbi:MAG: nucleoside triphosphate pyrophosphatase [Pseudomonadota bacterium]
MTDFILASQSPRRRDLLAQIGYVPSQVVPADIDETPQAKELPRPYAIRMAVEKAEAVAALYPNATLLAGDTVVAAGRRILGKAEDAAAAEKMLRLLAGRRHRVISAIAVKQGEKLWQRCVVSIVKIRPLSDAEVADYLKTGEWQGKAGGYALQGRAAAFIPWVQGSYSSIVGLPLAETHNVLRAAGVSQAT